MRYVFSHTISSRRSPSKSRKMVSIGGAQTIWWTPPQHERETAAACSKSKDMKHLFFWLVAAWVKSRAERPSVSGVNRQLHVQIGCKLGIRNRKDELTKQAKRNELQINPKVIKGVNACRKRTRSS